MNELVKHSEYTSEQVALIQRTIAVGCTPDELGLFFATLTRLELDPFTKQIYAIKRGGRLTIQIGIDGYRAIAERTGLLDGQETHWCGLDGIWRDVWLESSPPLAARVTLHRKGCSYPVTAVATLRSYEEKNNPIWRSKTDVMLAKCAESLALRKAFPSRLSGVYTFEEMANSEDEQPRHIRESVVEQVATHASKPAKSLPVIDMSSVDSDEIGIWRDAIADVSDEAELQKLADKIKTLPEAERNAVRPIYSARREQLRGAS